MLVSHFLPHVTSSAGTGDGWILQYAVFREPIARHYGTKQKAPGLRRGLMLKQQGSAYRLTWRLVPPPGPPPLGPRALSPLETTLTHSASLSLKYDVSLALRSASRLACGAPEAAVVNPGSSKITHEPLSISVRVRDTDGLSVVNLISVPARTSVAVRL